MTEARKEGRVFIRGKNWWIQFYVDGKQHREPAIGPKGRARSEEEAGKCLLGRLKKKHAHDEDPTKPFITQRDRRRTVGDLLDALKTDLEIRGKADPPTLSHIKRAKADFGDYRATQLTAEEIDAYVRDRLNPPDDLTPPSAKASVNRVTQLLGQAYKLAELPAPRIRKLSEKGNERKGFFDEQQIRAVIANLPADLADFTLFGWLTGMRKGEIEALSWEDVDGDVIRLAAIDSKEREARMIPLEGELAELFKRRQAARRVEVKGTVLLASLFFHIGGQPIGYFRKSWATACCAAGVGKRVCPTCTTDVTQKGECRRCGKTWKREDLKYVGRTFHDLRRSACRNMVRAGVPQRTAMDISGHKTDSMFRRYAIVAEDDLRTALRRTQEYLRSTAEEKVIAMAATARGQVGDSSGTEAVSAARRIR